MILYVNGDSHSAGAQAVNDFAFAQDDPKLWQDEWFNKPHPDNLPASYGQLLANKINAGFVCDAMPAGSNTRIIRTTREYLKTNKPNIIIIGWTSWEREEWFNDDDNVWYQVNASGIDSVPEKWTDRYKNFVVNVDWKKKEIFWHNEIKNFHLELRDLQIPHLFFNCYSNFFHSHNTFKNANLPFHQHEYGNNYINPYDDFHFINYLRSVGCKDVREPADPFIKNKRTHFGPDGHAKWAEFLLPYLTRLL